MRIIVGVKRVIDYAVKVRVRADRLGVETKNIKMSMNPFCEIALEQAVRLKEAGIAKHVMAVSIGDDKCSETLRTALAMGADTALHVKTGLRADQELQPLAVAKLLQALTIKNDPSLILLGKQSIDSDNGQVCQLLAGLLNWPQVTFASKIEMNDNKSEAYVTREIDGGVSYQYSKLPAVLSCDLRLCEPRYATLRNIMQARKKPIEVTSPEDLGIDVSPRLDIVKVEDPPTRSAGVILEDVDSLIAKLREAGLL